SQPTSTSVPYTTLFRSKWQIRVQAAYEVELQGAFARALFRAGVNLFQGEVVGARRAGVAGKSAELAMSDTHVGRIDVAVDVEIGDFAVFFLAHVIGQPANGQQVGRTVQRDAVFYTQPPTRKHFLRNRLQALIGDGKFAHYESVKNFKRAKPLPPRPRTAGTTY